VSNLGNDDNSDYNGSDNVSGGAAATTTTTTTPAAGTVNTNSIGDGGSANANAIDVSFLPPSSLSANLQLLERNDRWSLVRFVCRACALARNAIAYDAMRRHKDASVVYRLSVKEFMVRLAASDEWNALTYKCTHVHSFVPSSPCFFLKCCLPSFRQGVLGELAASDEWNAHTYTYTYILNTHTQHTYSCAVFASFYLIADGAEVRGKGRTDCSE
jgi:hypothetical protein